MNLATRVSAPALLPTGLPWLDSVLNGGLRRGGCYLLSGSPGSHKTTLAVHAALNLAAVGVKVMVILTEQQPSDINAIIDRICGGESVNCGAALHNLELEVADRPEMMLRLLQRRVFARVHDRQVIIIDSLQGGGVVSAATMAFRGFFTVLDEAKSRGITTITIAHVTKAGLIAGPKALEHKVDVVVILRKAYKFRPHFVIKNRFGPEVVEPLVLSADAGRLEPCPHTAAPCASALGFADELIEIQVAVGIPRFGARAELSAPFLPHKRIKQLVGTVSKLRGVDLQELSYSVNTFVPNSQGYTPAIDLPIAMALLAAYLQQPLSQRALFVGQIDLRLNIRSPDSNFMSVLAHVVGADSDGSIDRIFLSNGAAGFLREAMPARSGPPGPEIIGVRSLPDLIELLWPGILGGENTDGEIGS